MDKICLLPYDPSETSGMFFEVKCFGVGLKLSAKSRVGFALGCIIFRLVGIVLGSIWVNQCDSFGLAFYIILSSCINLLVLAITTFKHDCECYSDNLLPMYLGDENDIACFTIYGCFSTMLIFALPITDVIVGAILIWANYGICSSGLTGFAIAFIILSCCYPPIPFKPKDDD